MKTVVVYKSKSGFVKKYAEWIGKRLSADIFDASSTSIDKISTYDTIIYGGGLYAAGINGVKLITKNMEKLAGKNIVVFASGATPPREDAINEVIKSNFSEEQLKQIKFFYLRGGFDYKKLGFVDKLLMKLLKAKLKGKKDLAPDERGMLSAYDKPVDFTREKNIEELVKYVKQ